MKVLFATSEFADFAKAGGLGEVSAGLPRALRRRGVDVRVVLPAYPEVLAKAREITVVGHLPGHAGIDPCCIGQARTDDGLVLYLVLEPSLYQRTGSPYAGPEGLDWPDNDVRFGRLSLAAAQIAAGRAGMAWQPDVLHVNDWPSGLAPAYLRWQGARVPSVLTIHNIAYQGLYGRDRVQTLGIPEDAFHINGVEFHNRVSFLKAGMYYADHVATVSPTYAREITTEALGAGLHGLTQGLAAEGRLSGIVNGIDESWDPSRDPYLPHHFEADDMSGKQQNADLVRTGLCLKNSDGPLFGVVSRLVHQKGLDIVADTARDIVREGGQIAILGLGDPDTEHMLSRLARSHRDNIGLLIGFNEPMARRIVAASDFCLMPSRFEPCGLTQMQAQRYGTLPIAHRTGGLADTIEDGATGFLFSDLSGEGLFEACRRAFDVYGDADMLAEMRHAAMGRSFHWSGAAAEYEALYARLSGCRPEEAPPAPAPRRRARAAAEALPVAA
ncbi:MAG: glycogen synthase GlgA [Acetobacteraceae bacterium]